MKNSRGAQNAPKCSTTARERERDGNSVPQGDNPVKSGKKHWRHLTTCDTTPNQRKHNSVKPKENSLLYPDVSWNTVNEERFGVHRIANSEGFIDLKMVHISLLCSPPNPNTLLCIIPTNLTAVGYVCVPRRHSEARLRNHCNPPWAAALTHTSDIVNQIGKNTGL